MAPQIYKCTHKHTQNEIKAKKQNSLPVRYYMDIAFPSPERPNPPKPNQTHITQRTNGRQINKFQIKKKINKINLTQIMFAL